MSVPGAPRAHRPGSAHLQAAEELRPLKPGRGGHDLSRDEVAARQRARILRASVLVSAERGYPAMTVADITATAQVSRRTFYGLFGDKADCFIAAVEDVTSRLTTAMVAAAVPAAGDWLDGVRAMVARYLDDLAADPPTAQVLLIELLAAGPRGLEHRARTHAAFSSTFVAYYEQARAQDPRLPVIPAMAFTVANGGFDEVLTEWVRQGRFEALPQLTDLALYLARALPAGHHAAADLLPDPERTA